jgi:sterol desaturase/sphingolipid hydroxylase (fatty acid hydroxylase superfamily)
MNRLIDFITHSAEQIQIILFLATVFFCWSVENIVSMSSGYKKWKHAFLNAKFIATNIPIQLLLGLAMAGTIIWTDRHSFGLLHHLPYMKNKLIYFITSFILFDFGEYIYHLVMHKVKRLWMFHVVHHSDTIVDVSTTVREHPGENFIRTSITLLWVFLSGAALWVLLLRQIIQTFTTLFAHMNYRLPEKTDTIIGWVFITPNLHQVHHHYKQPYTDCNYGDVLSIWDRLFGTFGRLPANEVVFGLDTFIEEKETGRYLSLIKIPFGKYRKKIQ